MWGEPGTPGGVQGCARSPSRPTLMETYAEPEIAHFIDGETEVPKGRFSPLWETVWGHPGREPSTEETVAPK